MVNPIQNAAQQAYLNPFQKDNNQIQNQRDREQETQKSQDKTANNTSVRAAGSSDNGNARTSVNHTSAAGASEQSSNRQERGSLIDITV